MRSLENDLSKFGILNKQLNETSKAADSESLQRIIVIGASTGGFDAFKTIVSHLPPDFTASVFMVWHMSANVPGILPDVLNKITSIYVAHAHDNEEILPNRIYVARPDHHLLIEDGKVRVTRGPKENRFRPAIDPLFRSAAYFYGNRVIGVILSGALDDGTAGLWAVKQYGGLAVVQDPFDAEVASMPKNALQNVKVDYVVPVKEMSELLVKLSKEELPPKTAVISDEQTKKEIMTAKAGRALDTGLFNMGQLSPFTCPECHGVMAKYQNGNLLRYRCHTGHAYSADTLLATITEKIEENLYNAIRGIEENVMLLNHIGDQYAEMNHPKLAALYFQKAQEANTRVNSLRESAESRQTLSKELVEKTAEEKNN